MSIKDKFNVLFTTVSFPEVTTSQNKTETAP